MRRDMTRIALLVLLLALGVEVFYGYWFYGIGLQDRSVREDAMLVELTEASEDVAEGGDKTEATENPSESVDSMLEDTGLEAAVEGSEIIIATHRATSENISANSTYLDSPLINGKPSTVLIVTQNWNPAGGGGVYNDHPIGVWYDSTARRWAIFNQDRETMPEGASFNVLIRAPASS